MHLVQTDARLNGPADTEWARRRAQSGRPAPYQLKYLQLGNEERVDDRRHAPEGAVPDGETSLVTPETWVRDYIQSQRNYFSYLEEAAETIGQGRCGHSKGAECWVLGGRC